MTTQTVDLSLPFDQAWVPLWATYTGGLTPPIVLEPTRIGLHFTFLHVLFAWYIDRRKNGGEVGVSHHFEHAKRGKKWLFVTHFPTMVREVSLSKLPEPPSTVDDEHHKTWLLLHELTLLMALERVAPVAGGAK